MPHEHTARALIELMQIGKTSSSADPLLQHAPEAFDVIVATHKTIDLVFHTQVYKLKRDMTRKNSVSASLDLQAFSGNWLTFPYCDFSEYACGLADDTP